MLWQIYLLPSCSRKCKLKSHFCSYASQYSNDTLNKTFCSGYLGNCIKWTNDICSEQQLFQPEQIDTVAKQYAQDISPLVEGRTFSVLIYVSIFRCCFHFAAVILRGRRSERDIHWQEIGQGHGFLTGVISVEIITGERERLGKSPWWEILKNSLKRVDLPSHASPCLDCRSCAWSRTSDHHCAAQTRIFNDV